MSRYTDILNRGKERLKSSNIEDFNTDAWLLFEYVFKMSRTWYFLHQMEENTDLSSEDEYDKVIERRCGKIPLQHITGHQEFMGFDFFVNENTLIPRQDTEVLVEKAVSVIKDRVAEISSNSNNKQVKVLDMCTGTGCIGISIAKLLPCVRVTAVDVSDKALEIACKNGENLGVFNIEFIKSNMFNCIDKDIKYDFIISNPPYIKTEDIDKLMEEVKLHDPFIALDGREDGLYFYREITREAAMRLSEGGYLMYEIGYNQAEEVSEIMKKSGFGDVKVIRDLAGLDRVVTGKLHH